MKSVQNNIDSLHSGHKFSKMWKNMGKIWQKAWENSFLVFFLVRGRDGEGGEADSIGKYFNIYISYELNAFYIFKKVGTKEWAAETPRNNFNPHQLNLSQQTNNKQ